MRRNLMAIAVAVLTFGTGACGLLETKHEVGECVRTIVGLGGTEITSAECRGTGNVMDNLGDPIYVITAVLEYEDSCPEDGQYGIELQHEPDDAVYCLNLES